MKRLLPPLFVVTILCLFQNIMMAQALLGWDFNGKIGDELTVNAIAINSNITAGQISRGLGITAATNANSFNASHFTQPDLAAAISNNDYFEFNISPASGKSMSISAIKMNFQATSTAPTKWELRSSVDNYTTTLYSSSSLTTGALSIPLSSLNNLRSTTIFRFYGYGNTNAAGAAGFEGTGNDIEIDGTTADITYANNLIINALASITGAKKGEYFINVNEVTGGTAPYTLTIDGITKSFAGTPLVFGPYTFSGSGGAVKEVFASDASNALNKIEVVEALGGYKQASADCDCAASTANKGLILSQSKPGSFVAGGTSGRVQKYILVQANNIISTNQSGLFTDLANGAYEVFAINYDIADATIMNAALATGKSITEFKNGLIGTGTLANLCYALCGTATYTVDCTNTTTANIATQPQDATVCEGDAATFGVTASGTGLQYQWQISTDGTTFTNLSNGGVYSNTTEATLNISNTTGLSNKKYRVSITAGIGGCTTISNIVTLKLNTPTLLTLPNTANICANKSLKINTLSATITGGASTGLWSSSGSGTFTGGNTFAAATEYLPSAADIAAGIVSLTLKSDATTGSCGAVSKTLTLHIGTTNCGSFPWDGN